MLFTYTRKIFP